VSRVIHTFIADSSVPLAAEPIFHIGSFGVTNSMLAGIVVIATISIVFGIAAHRSRMVPISKFAYLIETLTEFILTTITGNFGGDEAKARRFLPLFLGLFGFILLNNLFGLLPGMGGSVYLENSGVREALLRPFTTDLNGTLALALISIGTVQFFGIKERGIFGHIRHYFSVTTPWWNPMNFLLGPIEILSEFIRLLTLAMRLFGVIYAGEVLLHVITALSGNFAWAGTVPVILMEIFFSCIQAYLFIMLSSVYLAIGTTKDESHEVSVAKVKSAHSSAGELSGSRA
jgi:F-type H+-transporting ATPase subunit a